MNYPINARIFLILLLLPFNTRAQYLINVQLREGIKDGKAFLRYFSPSGPFLDSSNIVQGKFSFKGNVPGRITVARIFILEPGTERPAPENICEVWLENGTTEIIGQKELAKVIYRGSVIQQQFSELQELLGPVKKKNAELDEAYEKAKAEKDDLKKDVLLNSEYPALYRQRQRLLEKFIKKYPASLVSAYKFEEFCGDERIDLSIADPVYKSLHDSIRRHPLVEKAAIRMQVNRQTAPGMRAPEFSQTDTTGRLISLSSFRGKYLLIDFWAGWCIPCRAENPHLKKLYGRYKNKGFEMLGISLDGERKRWTNAIISDKLDWPQLSDLAIFDNTVAKLYGINSIPQNVLLAPDGTIISWNLRGSALDKKLSELFKK